MKIAKGFAWIFAGLGTLLLLGSVVLCLFSLNARPQVKELPQGAVQCSEAFAEAIAAGDYDALESCIYGQPELGLSGAPEDTLSAMVWELVQLNLHMNWQGDCYVKDSALCRDASVTYMDVSSILENLPTRAADLLNQRVEAATDMEQLYDGSGEFRKDLIEEVVKAALTQCCMEDVKNVTVNVTVELICRDGQWWAVPDKQLMTALSAGAL